MSSPIQDPLPAQPERAGSASATPPGDVDCTHCGCAFIDTAVYDLHRPNGRCRKPTDAGLVVAPRVKLTWSVPIKVPVEVDAFGNVTQWVQVDREIAGHWDERQWRDHP